MASLQHCLLTCHLHIPRPARALCHQIADHLLQAAMISLQVLCSGLEGHLLDTHSGVRQIASVDCCFPQRLTMDVHVHVGEMGQGDYLDGDHLCPHLHPFCTIQLVAHNVRPRDREREYRAS